MTNKFHGYDNRTGKFVKIRKSGLLEKFSNQIQFGVQRITGKLDVNGCQNSDEELKQQLSCMQEKNLELMEQVEKMRREMECLQNEISNNAFLERQHEALLLRLQFLLGFPLEKERYNDSELLDGLLKELKKVIKELQNEGLTLLFEHTDETSDFFANQEDPYITEKEVTEPAILRNGTLVSIGVVNIPSKNIQQ